MHIHTTVDLILKMAINPIIARFARCLMLLILVCTFTSCNEKESKLRVSSTSTFSLNEMRTARIGDVIHGNKTELSNSVEIVTIEIELGGIHSSYGNGTAINFIYRATDTSGKNVMRPKVVTHRLSSGNNVEFLGGKLEIISFTSNSLTYEVIRDFNQVTN